MSSNWRELLDKVAPILEGSMEGPFRAFAIQFLIENLIEVPSDDPEKDLEDFLSTGDISIFQKLRDLDQEFQVKMESNGVTVNDLLEEELQKEKREKTPAILAGAITFGIFGMLVLITFVPVPRESSDIINIMLGALSSGWMSVLGYYFGFSRGQTLPVKMKP